MSRFQHFVYILRAYRGSKIGVLRAIRIALRDAFGIGPSYC